MAIPVLPAAVAPWLSRDGSVVLEEPDHASTVVWRPESGEVVVAGPRSRARYTANRPGPHCVQLRLRPGQAAALLDVPIPDLVDRTVLLPAVDAPRWEAVLHGDGSDDLAGRAAALLSAGISVRATADRLHVSERHLRDVFIASVGLAPTRFVRIDRVRSVLADVASGLPEAASRAGFYDQSHMTAQFHRLMGVPPHAFRSGRWPVAQPCGRSAAGPAN